MSIPLTGVEELPDGVARPGYTPGAHGEGIVHIGPGAFFRAHQAAYTDTALSVAGGDWRIAALSLNSTGTVDALTRQNGLYTLIEQSKTGTVARVIGSVARGLSLGRDRAAAMQALTAPATRIVTLTVTEKGYGIDRATGGMDRAHPAIAHDLEHPETPIGVAGLLVAALGQRRAAGVPPFTVLSCDNLPENGHLLKALLVDFARAVNGPLADHIAGHVAFPCSMVDRITPAASDATLAAAEAATGFRDDAAIEAEAFSQWVIEDNFPQGRPSWEQAGAMVVADVRAYELMKLRMLNGAHSMLAYAGFIAGHALVADVMRDKGLARLVHRHMLAAAATLPPVPGVDTGAYADALVARFENPHLRHATYQIAMDGTEKLPQRILAPAVDALNAGQDPAPFAFATAAWMRFTLGRSEAGEAYALRDPQEARLAEAVAGLSEPGQVVGRLMSLPGLFPDALRDNAEWTRAVETHLAVMMQRGMRAAIDSA